MDFSAENLLILFLLAAAATPCAVFYFLFHKPRRMMAAKAATLMKRSAVASGGTVVEGWYSAKLATARYGRRISAHFSMKAEGVKKPALTIAVELKMNGSFLINPALIIPGETPLEALESGGIGAIAPRVLTGDSRLDLNFQVLSFQEEFVKTNLLEEKRIRAISKAFSSGARRIIFNGKRLILEWNPLSVEAWEHNPSMIGESIESLSDIANGLTPARAMGFGERLSGLGRANLGEVAVVIACVVVYFAIKIYLALRK